MQLKCLEKEVQSEKFMPEPSQVSEGDTNKEVLPEATRHVERDQSDYQSARDRKMRIIKAPERLGFADFCICICGSH